MEYVPNRSPTLVDADITDGVDRWCQVMAGADYVIHCAAVLPNKEPKDGEVSVVGVNVNGLFTSVDYLFIYHCDYLLIVCDCF